MIPTVVFVFICVPHLLSSFSLFCAYFNPPPTSPPLFPRLCCPSLTPLSLFFFRHVNSVQPESEHHKAVTLGIHSAFITSSQRGIRLLYSSLQRSSEPSFHLSDIQFSPYSIIPTSNPVLIPSLSMSLSALTIIETIHSAVIPSFKAPYSSHHSIHPLLYHFIPLQQHYSSLNLII